MSNCLKCWHPSDHNPGCPDAGGSQDEFDKGQGDGFYGIILTGHELYARTDSFQLGYRKGRAELEQLVDIAVMER